MASTYVETVRLWWNRFGSLFAGEIRGQRISRMQGFRHWRWHLDEMYVKLNHRRGPRELCHQTRDKQAALAFMRKVLKQHGSPDKIVTGGLRSYGTAMTDVGNREKQKIGRWANNRVENSRLPFRRRERAMLRFRRMQSLQKFASANANVHHQFNFERPLIDQQTYKERRSAALVEWQIIMG